MKTSFKLLKNKLAVILIFLAAILISCGNNSEMGNANNGERLIPSVEAVQAHFGSLPLSERLTGVVRAKNQVAIYPEISAAITDVYVHNGEMVKKGQPLVRLRDREFQERLNQAKAEYQIAVAQAKQAGARLKEVKSELQRIESLAEKGLASAAQLQTAQTQAISAEASLELANARVDQVKATVEERESALSETVIRAPVAGTVGTRNAEIGMIVNANTRLFTLGQLDNVRIEIILTDRMLNYIQTGQRSEILSDMLPSGSVEAPLTRISPFLHPVSHTTLGEIDLKNPDESLKPGMFVAVDVYYGESENATLVPLSALYENPNTGETGVYINSDTLALNREPVSTSESDKSMALTNPVEFTFVPVDVIAKGKMQAGINGIEPGSWIVTLGQNLIGGNSGNARVHKVNWNWIEKLQQLQSQDLLKDIMRRQQ
ncbi:MAG: efflux RND transporter periplasmic adaptor subunit, partial [Calditrichaceae bacterium]|nr:efflux RND transporter periplasmic adaptor subunit [Calditrichaceae bacterium]